MIHDETTGLVFRKGDTENLADVLDRLIGDPDLRARLAKNGRAWVAAERTWAQMGRRTADLLAGLRETSARAGDRAASVG